MRINPISISHAAAIERGRGGGYRYSQGCIAICKQGRHRKKQKYKHTIHCPGEQEDYTGWDGTQNDYQTDCTTQ